MDSFYEIAIKQAVKQPEIVDRITKAAPILSALPMQASSNGLSNVYEEIVSIDSAQEVDYDSDLPVVDAVSKVSETQLTKFGAQMVVGMDRLQELKMTPAEYFYNKSIKVAKRTAMNIEYAMLYNLLRARAITAGNYTAAGGAANINYSLIFATFEPGENVGLYNPAGLGNGEIMDLLPLNNGAAHKITYNGKTFTGYAMDMSTNFGIQIANVDALYCIPDIDLTISEGEYTALPTASMIDDALDAVEASASNTIIMGHPRLLTALGEEYKGDLVRMTTQERDVNKIITSWNTIPMIGSRNFKKGTEEDVD